jgi:protein-disulfide isomerase
MMKPGYRVFLLALAGALQHDAQTPHAQTTGTGGNVAYVAGQAVSDAELTTMAEPQLRQVRSQEYEIKRRVLEDLIQKKVLQIEAAKRGLSVEQLLQQEVDAKTADPSEPEVQAFYLGQKERNSRPYDELKSQMKDSLRQARIQQARQEYQKRLREGQQIAILLRPPRAAIGVDPGRIRGNPQAPVTIVEFSDFECPYCQSAQSIVKEVMNKYAGRVKLAFRDLPLRQIHPQAQMAAEASRCAGEQGKFWEYHDQLFANPGNLTRDGLVEHARNLKLDGGRFEECLASGKFRQSIESDYQEGMRAGITGTPAFFVNGQPLTGAQPVGAFSRIIDEELEAARYLSGAGNSTNTSR